MTIYNKFNKLNIDTMLLGIEQGITKTYIFCTPKGAKIIGWEVLMASILLYTWVWRNGICSQPMNTPGSYVHPLASTFSDFLCLLLVCGNTAALEQVHGWNQEEFGIFLKESPVTEEQLSVLSIIREKLHLEPIDHPFTYIKQLQAKFDYNKI